MSSKQILETGLLLGGAALGAAGAVLIEPAVIGVGVLAAGTVAVMRFSDRKAISQRVKMATLASVMKK